jgi:hypothetical protein
MDQQEQGMAEGKSGGRRRPRPRAVAWPLARTLSLILVLVLTLTMSVAGFLAYDRFAGVYASLVQSRYGFVAFFIKKKVEDSLGSGVDLRQLVQIQEVIEGEKRRDPGILSIELTDAAGATAFTTGRVSRPVDDKDALVAAVPLVGAHGKAAGAIALRYARAEAHMGGSAANLSLRAAVDWAVFALLALLAPFLLFRRVDRKLDAMERTLEAVMTQGGQAVADAGGDPVEVAFAEFVATSRQAVDEIIDATNEVARLDRLAP